MEFGAPQLRRLLFEPLPADQVGAILGDNRLGQILFKVHLEDGEALDFEGAMDHGGDHGQCLVEVQAGIESEADLAQSREMLDLFRERYIALVQRFVVAGQLFLVDSVHGSPNGGCRPCMITARPPPAKSFPFQAKVLYHFQPCLPQGWPGEGPNQEKIAMPMIRRAIISCHDKTGLVEFASALRDAGVEIISTIGTMEMLKENGIDSMSIVEFTGVQEMLDGRVKSLHPKVHAGLLAVRDNKLHQEQMEEHDYKWIDLVVVNLHPVQSLMAKSDITMDEIIDQIDIGGCAMIRSAAKNFRYVTVVVNPDRYATVLHAMRAHEGEVPFPTRYRLAKEAFAHTSEYDRIIADYLERTVPPEE